MKQYIEDKITMLTKDFRIKLSYDEVEALKSATTETQVDRIAHDIFLNKLP